MPQSNRQSVLFLAVNKVASRRAKTIPNRMLATHGCPPFVSLNDSMATRKKASRCSAALFETDLDLGFLLFDVSPEKSAPHVFACTTLPCGFGTAEIYQSRAGSLENSARVKTFLTVNDWIEGPLQQRPDIDIA